MKQDIGTDVVGVVQCSMVGYHTYDKMTVCDTVCLFNKLSKHFVDFFQAACSFLTVNTVLMSAFVKACKICRHKERFFGNYRSDLIAKHPESRFASLRITFIGKIKATGILSDFFFHFQNDSLGMCNGINKKAVKRRTVPPEFRRDKITLCTYRSREGNAGRPVAVFFCGFPESFYLCIYEPVPCTKMAAGGIKDSIIKCFVGCRVCSGDHTLMTWIGECWKNTFHAVWSC